MSAVATVQTIIEALAWFFGALSVVGTAVLFAMGLAKDRRRQEEETASVYVEETPDPWRGFVEARRRHPLPAAHSELEQMEIAGPVHVWKAERVVDAGRRS